MSASLPGHSAPTAGFEVPLEMLSACHLRIEQQCSTLRRLVKHLASHGTDSEARLAAANVIRYFETAAKDHHADEEEDLFPALMESMAGSDAVCLRELTQGLAAEHRELETRWQHLRATLERVVANRAHRSAPRRSRRSSGCTSITSSARKASSCRWLARLLSGIELNRIGRAMRERRGIDLEP